MLESHILGRQSVSCISQYNVINKAYLVNIWRYANDTMAKYDMKWQNNSSFHFSVNFSFYGCSMIFLFLDYVISII